MAIFQIKLSKFLYFVYFVICIKCNHGLAQTDEINFNFEQMKSDLFSFSDTDGLNLTKTNGIEDIGQYLKCIKDLNAIRKGLTNFEQWAMKSE